MAAKLGANTIIGVKLGGTIGTAVQAATGDKFLVESGSFSPNTEVLRLNPIGSGNVMDNVATPGFSSPNLNFDCIDFYDGPSQALTALFFGADSVSSGGGAYTHSILTEVNRHSKFATVAFEGSDSGVHEFPSCTPRKLTISYSNPPAWVKKNIELLADRMDVLGTTNTNATLASCTQASVKQVVVKRSDQFMINAASGAALSASDHVSIVSAVAEYNFEVSHAREIANSTSGAGVPILTGDPPMSATLTVTFRNQADFTWWNAQRNATEYKAQLVVTGDVIAGSIPYSAKLCFPRLVVAEDPQFGLQSTASNPLTVKFRALVASANPTGMLQCYPYVLLTNAKSTSYMA